MGRWLHRIRLPYVLGRKDPSHEDVNSQLLSHPRSLSPFSRLSFLLFPLPFLREISVVIYHSPLFILLIHLLVIYAHT